MYDAVARCAEDVSRLVEDLFGAILPSEEAFAILMDLVDDRIAVTLAERVAPPPACGPGCAACCTVNVGTLAVEGAAVAAFLRRKLGPERARDAGRLLLQFHEQVRWLDDGERIRARLRCPFLDEDLACSIHPVRPLACRSVSSLDPAACRRALAERAGVDDEAGDGAVPMDLLQRAVHDATLEAIAQALATRGLDGRLRDVTGMAGAFLCDPELAAAYGRGARLPLE
jgi:Fe-S-cluster containining protein